METFGQKLKRAVDEHGLTIEDVARATGLDIVHLRALARDDLATIPADDSITDGLEAFARMVGVDPHEVVADYRFEREVEQAATPAEGTISIVPETPCLPVEEAQPPASPSAGLRGRLAVVVIALVLAAAAILWVRSPAPQDVQPVEPMSAVEIAGGPGAAEAPAVTPRSAESIPAVVVPPSAESTPAVTSPRPTESTPVVTKAEVAPAPGTLAIPRHGVGTGVVNHALVGKGERFAEGTRVWFWTWVEGATAGDVIRHVWIHEGQEMLSTPLNLGGTRWRTHSYKNLHAGSAGEWVAEARDSTDRVLARQVFQCFQPASS